MSRDACCRSVAVMRVRPFQEKSIERVVYSKCARTDHGVVQDGKAARRRALCGAVDPGVMTRRATAYESAPILPIQDSIHGMNDPARSSKRRLQRAR